MIREVRLEDAGRLAEIYSYYVQNTAISFEYEAPSASEFESRIKSVTAKYPYLVCEKDGRAIGYAYASAYSVRSAYAWTATSSIYVDKEFRRQGIGSMLYGELEKRLREMGIVNLLAGAAYSEEEDEYLTHDSYKFHTRMGYEKVAHLKTVGKKFDRWYDLIWMQKKL
ncbi:MAG: N-acetyltransferase [Lachnospiraceae bacterium]|nr:N-acetyltransferase [Lachnospiraceae bacterium]